MIMNKMNMIYKMVASAMTFNNTNRTTAILLLYCKTNNFQHVLYLCQNFKGSNHDSICWEHWQCMNLL